MEKFTELAVTPPQWLHERDLLRLKDLTSDLSLGIVKNFRRFLNVDFENKFSGKNLAPSQWRWISYDIIITRASSMSHRLWQFIYKNKFPNRIFSKFSAQIWIKDFFKLPNENRFDNFDFFGSRFFSKTRTSCKPQSVISICQSTTTINGNPSKNSQSTTLQAL